MSEQLSSGCGGLRSALLQPSSARSWVRSHPLELHQYHCPRSGPAHFTRRDLHQNQKLQNRVYKSLVLNYVCFRNTWVLVKAQVLSLPPKTLIHEVQDWVWEVTAATSGKAVLAESYTCVESYTWGFWKNIHSRPIEVWVWYPSLAQI